MAKDCKKSEGQFVALIVISLLYFMMLFSTCDLFLMDHYGGAPCFKNYILDILSFQVSFFIVCLLVFSTVIGFNLYKMVIFGILMLSFILLLDEKTDCVMVVRTVNDATKEIQRGLITESLKPISLFGIVFATMTLILSWIALFFEPMKGKKGTVFFADGSLFEGYIKNGVANATGTFTDKAGNEYFGKWKNGKHVKAFKNSDTYSGIVELPQKDV